MAYASSFARQQLEGGKTFKVVHTNGPMDDNIPASYTISATQVPPGMQHEPDRRFHVEERDHRGEVKNIRILTPSEARAWLDYKAGFLSWQFTDAKTGKPAVLH